MRGRNRKLWRCFAARIRRAFSNFLPSRVTVFLGVRGADLPSAVGRARELPECDPGGYGGFEGCKNDMVARDVRVAVGDTLARVLPEGIAEGAARRIGEDIFNEIHRTLAADRTLSEQVGEILRGSSRDFTASGWRFGTAQQQRVAALLARRGVHHVRRRLLAPV